MKSLIIGAAGFVGKHLASHLIGAGWDVEATRLPSETIDIDIPVHELDILEPDSISKLLNIVKPDYIFHLAAQSSVPISWDKPSLTIDVNIKGTVNLLEAIRNLETNPRILLIGSGEEYGYVLPEDIPIKESAPLRPGNVYAATKITQGLLGQIYAQAYGLDVVIVRAFNHAGPGQSDIFALSNFCKQVAMIESGLVDSIIEVGNLEAKRDFTDVRDVVKAYKLLIEKGESGIVYNVGTGKAVSIRALLDKILSLSNVSIEVELDESRMRPSDTPIIEPDITLLTKQTGWKPEISIESTLLDILNEWRETIK